MVCVGNRFSLPLVSAQWPVMIKIAETRWFVCLCLWNFLYSDLVHGMATLPQGNQELIVVRNKVGRPPGELGVSKSMKCDIFPFSALTLLVHLENGR